MHGVSTFIGSYEHNLDAKNRLFVPAKFRDALTSTFIIKLLPSQYPCIQCFSKDEYDAYAASVLAGFTDPVRQRKKQFELYAGAAEVTVDAQGRIMIPVASTQRAPVGDHVSGHQTARQSGADRLGFGRGGRNNNHSYKLRIRFYIILT